MSHWSRWMGLLLVPALVLSLLAAADAQDAKKDAKKAEAKADKKADDKGKDDKKADDKPAPKAGERLSYGTVLAGKLQIDANSQKDFTLHISQKVVVPNPAAIQQMLVQQAQLAQRQAQIMRNPNPIQRQQQLAQLMRDMAQGQQNLYQVQDLNQNVKLRAAENIKVRLLSPPLDYDDKGN